MGIAHQEQVILPYLERPASWATLENGHQVIAIRKPGEVVHVHTVVRTGSVNESDDNTGVSHFLEHLMFKGTERFPAGAMDRLLEGVGARVNASTSRDLTQYFITLPMGQAEEYYRLALDLHADMLLHAALPEEEIGPPFDPDDPQVAERRERMVVIEEIKMGHDNPWRQAIQQLTTLLYPTHPYRRDVIGTAQVIAGIPRAEILDYYRTWYQPANMITIVTADRDEQQVIRDVELNFDFHAARPIELPSFPAEAPPAEPKIANLAMPLNVSYIVLGFLGPASTDLRATIALDAISLLLGEGLSSRLHQRLLEQLPDTPFIDVGSTHWTYRDSSNVLAYGIVRPEERQRAFELLRDEVAKMQREPPSADEMEKAVTRLETQFAAQAETAAGLAYAVADSMARLNNPTGYTGYLPVLHSLTRDDLVRYATEYLSLERFCAVFVGPASGEG